MPKPNINDAIEIPKKLLILTGHWPLKKPTIINYFKAFLSNFIEISFEVTLFMELSNVFDSINDLTDHLSLLVSPTSFLFKLIIFWMNHKYITILTEQMNDETFNTYPDHLEVHMSNAVRFSRLIGNIYQWTCAIVITNYSFIIPILTGNNLPLRFSFDIGKWSYGIYVLQVLGLGNAAYVNSCIDVLGYSLMSIASAQLDILNGKIISSIPQHQKNIVEEDVKKVLSECVMHHNKIIRFLLNIERVFTQMFLVQYLTSILVICNIGFQLVHVNIRSIQFLNMCFYFMAMLTQLSIYCWNGNEIILKSSTTRDACYNSNWSVCGSEIRKMLFIISERSKKPLYLSAGKFSKLSLATFTSVINSSYSYFTLMQRLDAKHKRQ